MPGRGTTSRPRLLTSGTSSRSISAGMATANTPRHQHTSPTTILTTWWRWQMPSDLTVSRHLAEVPKPGLLLRQRLPLPPQSRLYDLADEHRVVPRRQLVAHAALQVTERIGQERDAGLARLPGLAGYLIRMGLRLAAEVAGQLLLPRLVDVHA